jgi:hypothetical protein
VGFVVVMEGVISLLWDRQRLSVSPLGGSVPGVKANLALSFLSHERGEGVKKGSLEEPKKHLEKGTTIYNNHTPEWRQLGWFILPC